MSAGRTFAVNVTVIVRIMRQRELDAALRRAPLNMLSRFFHDLGVRHSPGAYDTLQQLPACVSCMPVNSCFKRTVGIGTTVCTSGMHVQAGRQHRDGTYGITLSDFCHSAAPPTFGRDKFGEAGARVFKLLAGSRQQLEQKMVSERALLPIKDARELLYRMLRARYLSLQVEFAALFCCPHLTCLVCHMGS